MNATDLQDIAARLGHALTITGLTVERAQSIRGQLCYERIPDEALLGRLLQLGWRVSYGGPGERPVSLGTDPAQRNLRLVDSSTVSDEEEGT